MGATGSYSNLFRVFGCADGSTETTTLEASKNPMRRQVPTPSRPSRSLGSITRVVRRGGESPGVDANGNSFDFTTKLLHLAWHPTENSIACAAANSLYMYYAWRWWIDFCWLKLFWVAIGESTLPFCAHTGNMRGSRKISHISSGSYISRFQWGHFCIIQDDATHLYYRPSRYLSSGFWFPPISLFLATLSSQRKDANLFSILLGWNQENVIVALLQQNVHYCPLVLR